MIALTADAAISARQRVDHGHGPQMTHGGMKPADEAGCADPTLACASTVTPFVGADGTVWVAFAAGKRVFVTHSSDRGRTFGPVVPITPEPVMLDGGADARPQIVVDAHRHVVVSYAILRGERFVGQVFVSHSADGGRTFAAPRPISDDPASQRFITLGLDASGDIFAAWVDKRRLLEAQRAKRPFHGASLAVAWSRDGGRTFSPAALVHDESCECCRLAIAFKAPHQPVILFRNIFAGERDHAIVALDAKDAPGPVTRVGDDHWKIDACPHHGPSLAIDAAGIHHAAWFSGAEHRQGLFYARSADGGRSFSAPLPIGSVERQSGRPSLLAQGDAVWLAWKEYDDGRSTILAMQSRDGGRTWSPPLSLSQTDGASDHPLLITIDRQPYLSWMTRRDGYRLVPLTS